MLTLCRCRPERCRAGRRSARPALRREGHVLRPRPRVGRVVAGRGAVDDDAVLGARDVDVRLGGRSCRDVERDRVAPVREAVLVGVGHHREGHSAAARRRAAAVLASAVPLPAKAIGTIVSTRTTITATKTKRRAGEIVVARLPPRGASCARVASEIEVRLAEASARRSTRRTLTRVMSAMRRDEGERRRRPRRLVSCVDGLRSGGEAQRADRDGAQALM